MAQSSRVLVVDDDTFAVSVVRQQLHDLGVVVSSAYTADDFKKHWRDADVIVLDIRIPEREGESTGEWVGLQTLYKIQQECVALGNCPRQIYRCILYSGLNKQDAIGAQI